MNIWNSIISILLFCFTSYSRLWVLCNYCLFKHIRLSIVNVPIKSVVLFLFFQPVEIQLCIDNQSRQYFPVKEVELAHIYVHTHLHTWQYLSYWSIKVFKDYSVLRKWMIQIHIGWFYGSLAPWEEKEGRILNNQQRSSWTIT